MNEIYDMSVDYKQKIEQLICKDIDIIPYSKEQIDCLCSIVEDCYKSVSINKMFDVNYIYLCFFIKLKIVPLRCFKYAEIVNLLYNISNNLLILYK